MKPITTDFRGCPIVQNINPKSANFTVTWSMPSTLRLWVPEGSYKNHSFIYVPSANVWAALAKSNFICCTEILWNLKLLLKISTKYTPLRKFICMYHLYNIRERNKWLFPTNTYSKNVRSHLVQSLSFTGFVLIFWQNHMCSCLSCIIIPRSNNPGKVQFKHTHNFPFCFGFFS